MRRLLGGLILSTVLLVPVAMQAEERRYYDRDRRDHHVWNDGENRAYNRYLEERKEERRREFNRENRQRQTAYWRWRHDHSDSVLFPR